MSEKVNNEPDVKAIIQSHQTTIPSSQTQLCCLLRKPAQRIPTKMVEEDIYEFYRSRLAAMDDEDVDCQKKFCKCKRFDPYTTCVKVTRTIQQQKRHAIARENYLRTKWILEHPSYESKPKERKTKKVIKIENVSQAEEEEVRLRLASPSCSRQVFFKPTRNLMDLKKPKSGIFINLKAAKGKGLQLPFQDYNARIIQDNLDTTYCGLYKLDQDLEGNYIWVNDVLRKKKAGGDYRRETYLKECKHFKPKYYEMPDDVASSFKPSTQVIQGTSVVMPLDSVQDYRRPKEIACIFVAFSQEFATPKAWDSKLIDYILVKGEELHQQSLAIKYSNPNVDFDIIPEITEAETTIEYYLHFSSLLTGNPNLLKVLSLFFESYNAAIFCCEDMYLLILKQTQDGFKIFDPNGRTIDGCASAKGLASVITTSPVEHLAHLILNLSSLAPMSTYVLYEIRLQHFGHIPEPMDKADATKKPKKLYQVVNKHFALVPGNSGIPNPQTSNDVNSSLMVAYITIVYIELDPPNYWGVKIVDDLIKYGTMRYKDFVFEKQITKCTIGHLPADLVFGSYRSKVTFKPFQYMGSISKNDSAKGSNVGNAILDFFNNNKAGILEIDTSAFAIWKDSNFYYVLDPFKRGAMGIANKDPREPGIGYLQLHITLDSLCHVMVKNAGKFMTSGKFFIHGIKINSVTVFNANKQLLMGNNFDSLYIVYPFPCPFPPPKYINCDILRSSESLPQLECLSILSEAPCERVCSESDFLAQEKRAKRNEMIIESLKKSQSILSIDETAGVTYFDGRDVVESLLDLILNDVMDEIAERDKKRKPTKSGKKKSVKPQEGEEARSKAGEDKTSDGDELKSEQGAPRLPTAERILVHTDEAYLKELKKKYKRGQLTEDVCKNFQSILIKQKRLSLEEELQVKSNFQSVPDGSWVLLSQTEDYSEEQGRTYIDGVISAVMSIILSYIYNISTWDAITLDNTSNYASKVNENIDHTIATLLRSPFPQMSFEEQVYNIEITKHVHGEMLKFDGAINDELQVTDRVLVIFKRFACAIFRRYNFYYLYQGFPTDLVGFRASQGYLCLSRHTNLESMMKRVEFGRMNAGDADAFVICHVRLSNDERSPFVERTPSNEQMNIKRELESQKEYNKLRGERLKLITNEIKKEKQRIESFKKDKEKVEKEREQRTKKKEERRRLREERAQKREEKKQKLAEEKKQREQEALEREEQEEKERLEAEEKKRQRREERKRAAEERNLKAADRKREEEEELERRKNMPPEQAPPPAAPEKARESGGAEAKKRLAGGDDNDGEEVREDKEGGKVEEDLLVQEEEEGKVEPEEEEEEEEDDEEVEPKHVPGVQLSTHDLEELTVEPTVIGYKFTLRECLFKIQGSTALEDRKSTFAKKIKDCQLACVFAILSAILRPLRLWDSFRIDQCVEKGKLLGKRIKSKAIVSERIIRNLVVDDFIFSVMVCISDVNIPSNTVMGPYINRILMTTKYFIIQISNCSFAVYKDEFFHLFDPYNTLEKGKEEEGEEEDMEENEEEPECARDVPFEKHTDRATASWVLFAELKDMLKYIEKRAASDRWMEKFKLYVVKILKYSKANKDIQIANALEKNYVAKIEEKVEDEDILYLDPEGTDWLTTKQQIPWSRLINVNSVGVPRASAFDREFDTEIPGKLWSLWGNIHPTNSIFGESKGKQYLAVNVMSICIINTFRFHEWNRQIIDNIILHGDRYFKESIKDIKKKEYELTLEDLEVAYNMDHITFKIHIESVAYGRLYNREKHELNLAASLGYFFFYFKDGVIQCNGRSFAFGKTNIGYYMFDCQAFGSPLFPPGHGSAYILRSSTLQQLMKCMVVTFNLPYYNMDFVIHKVELTAKKAEKEEEEPQAEEEENEEAEVAADAT